MRIFLSFLILMFSFQSWIKADDITELEIENMSVGDSLLNYYSEEEISNFDKVEYKSDRYTDVVIVGEFATFEELHVSFLTEDPKKVIAGLDGLINYETNIQECHKKIKEIYKEVLTIVTDLNDLGLESNPMKGTSGTFTDYVLETENEDEIQIACYDYHTDEYIDHLRLGLRTIDLRNFIRNEAY